MPIYYRVDLRNSSMREFAFGSPWFALPIIFLFKTLRLPFVASTDDPPVDSITSFEADATALPANLLPTVQQLSDELSGLGFQDSVYHVIPDPLHSTMHYWVTLRHKSGRAWARIHCRVWTAANRTLCFPIMFSAMRDGSYVMTSGGKQDTLVPETTQFSNKIGAKPAELWERHQAALEASERGQVRTMTSQSEVKAAMEDLHEQMRDFHLNRKIFKPIPESEQPKTTASTAAASEDDAVFMELLKQQNEQASWKAGILLLIVTLLLFWQDRGIGAFVSKWVLVPVLLFHELGHYVAMRWFGYRNLKMFFIPFFGAAVSGKHYNVAGWKKAVVALMGPIPGIILGGILGGISIYFHKPALMSPAFFMLFLNAFNLIPILPFDGGWVVHVVLFNRHPLLDVTFRVVTIAALVLLAYAFEITALWIVAVFMFLNLPTAYRQGRIVQRLRREGVESQSDDSQNIPPETALRILGEVRKTMPQFKQPKLVANLVLQIFEMLNTRPPGLWASIGLLIAHVAGFAGAIVIAMFLVFNRPSLVDLEPPKHVFVPAAAAIWRGADRANGPHSTTIATFAAGEAATRLFETMPRELPPDATLRLIGKSLLLTLPENREQDRVRWAEQCAYSRRRGFARP